MTLNYLSLVFLLISLGIQASAASDNPESIWSKVTIYLEVLFVEDNLFPKIIPSTNLSWIACYDAGLECARFNVRHSTPLFFS
jgi:hypothetical protein